MVYFDRHQTRISEIFSSRADVRIAWGGREAIESVAALPKKYTCQDILFGPKLSMMVIGSDALDSDKSIRKLVRRLLQTQVCLISLPAHLPILFLLRRRPDFSTGVCEKLAAGMDKALTRLPTLEPDAGQANKIRAKIAEFGFVGESWADPELDGRF